MDQAGLAADMADGCHRFALLLSGAFRKASAVEKVVFIGAQGGW